jgi:hypothetical protein
MERAEVEDIIKFNWKMIICQHSELVKESKMLTNNSFQKMIELEMKMMNACRNLRLIEQIE